MTGSVKDRIERQLFEKSEMFPVGDEDIPAVERFKKGDDKAFEEIVAKYYRPVLNIAYRYSNDLEEALDITQDVFLKIMKKINLFEGRCRFYTWIYAVATRTCMDRWRKLKRFLDIFGRSGSPKEELISKFSARVAEPEEALMNRETEREISLAMMKLDKTYRMVFILRDIAGLSYEDISQILGIGLATVKTRIHRARMELRKLLKDRL